MWGSQFDPNAGSWSARQQVSDGAVNTGGNTTFPPDVRIAVAFASSQITAGWEDGRNGNPDIYSRRATLSAAVDHFTYAYDGLNRLTSATGPVAESFTFDAATNIASRTGPSASNSFDGSNRQTSDGARTFTWNAADRLAQRGSDTFSYDPLARLTSSTVTGATRTFRYNGDGLLGSATQGANSSNYLWDSSSAAAPLLIAGTDRIVYGLGPLYAVRADGTTYTFARDGLGSVRAELTDSGALSKSFRYAAYGTLAQSVGGGPTLLGYAGELQDANGLVYLRSRWYDPVVGRFMSADAYSGAQPAPRSLNRYAYTEANPVNGRDPSGYCVDPGGPGIRYCVETFIPTRFACPFPLPCGVGDNRGPSADSGDDSYRVRQLITADGSVTNFAGISSLGFFGWGRTRGSLENCTEQTDPGSVNVSCTGFNGYARTPGSPGPIRTQVQIYEANGRVVVTAFGTFFPSLEVWRYGAGGPQLLYWYDARAVDIWSLGHVGHLPNSAAK
jgi:RHS repeat-associated protein